MQDFINYILNNGETIIAILTGVVTVASLVANLIPGESDSVAIAKVKKAVDWLALNFSKVKK